MEEIELKNGFNVPATVSRTLRGSFVSYELKKRNCHAIERTPGVLDLERAMKAYEKAFKRYRFMIKTGKL